MFQLSHSFLAIHRFTIVYMAQSTWFELRTGEGAEVGWKKRTNDVGVEIKEGFSAGKDSNCFPHLNLSPPYIHDSFVFLLFLS